jgi:transcriptional regulator with XRE-family HTH domain
MASLAKILSMNTILDLMKSPREIELEIAKNARRRRKEAGLTQEELARKSGVSLGSLKRFENRGKISMESLIKIAVALDYQEDFLKLFTQRRYRSIEEIIHERD